MPDYSQPGSDGAIPFALSEWRRGVVYTVRPEALAPLERGREYRIMTLVRRRQTRRSPGYGGLYEQAVRFGRIRAAESTCATPGEPLQAWIKTHTWRTLEAGPRSHALAAISTRLRFPNPGDARPVGEPPPAAEALMAPGGATPEALAEGADPQAIKQFAEIFNDFDFAAEPGPGLFSYGEYVPSAAAVHFEPFLKRAEHRARSWDGSIKIIGREWFCATSPDLAVVHLYYEST